MITGQDIKEARERAGMTQAQLAAAVGSSPDGIRAYEQGKRDIAKAQFGIIIKIIKILNIEI